MDSWNRISPRIECMKFSENHPKLTHFKRMSKLNMYDVNNIILKFQSDKDLNKFVQANLRESPFHRK